MGKEHYIEHLKEQMHEIMERPVTLGRAEEVMVYADAICALHKLDDDHFREATKMTILPTPAKWLLHFLQQGYSPERALPQAVRRSLLLSPPDVLFFIPKTGGDKH